MAEPRGCQGCTDLGEFCEGDEENAGDCREINGWLEAIGGPALGGPLAPQPAFELPPFFPQLLNQVELASMIAREPVVGVGIAKALTPRGKISHRAIPAPYATHSLRAQWGIGEETLLVCIGNYLDGYLERLWAAQARQNVWGRLAALGFNAATSLNFSIYLDRPRLEHLVNIKRSWLTVRRMQQTSSLIPIPHLQWAFLLDLRRQLGYAREYGFHTLTLNLQMIKRQGWDMVAAGLPIIQEQAPELRLLFAGVASLKRMAELAALFPTASFTNTTAHYLAQRHVRLRRDGTRLIKEPVDGHPDLVLAENVRLYREFLAEVTGRGPQLRSPTLAPATRLYAAQQEVAAALQDRLGFDASAAQMAADRLAVDEEILLACQRWLQTGILDQGFQGSFPGWPCAGQVPHPTLGDLTAAGKSPLEAFLRLADLAHQVDEEIQVLAGQSGY